MFKLWIVATVMLLVLLVACNHAEIEVLVMVALGGGLLIASNLDTMLEEHRYVRGRLKMITENAEYLADIKSKAFDRINDLEELCEDNGIDFDHLEKQPGVSCW